MLTRRNTENDIKTGGVSISRDKLAGELRMLCKWCPAYSGRDSLPGFPWELREPVIAMPREKRESNRASVRVPMCDTGAELLVVAKKVL